MVSADVKQRMKTAYRGSHTHTHTKPLRAGRHTTCRQATLKKTANRGSLSLSLSLSLSHTHTHTQTCRRTHTHKNNNMQAHTPYTHDKWTLLYTKHTHTPRQTRGTGIAAQCQAGTPRPGLTSDRNSSQSWDQNP